LRQFFDQPFASKAIYSLITVMALLLVMEDHPPTALQGAITLFGATLAIALAEVYAETIAETIAHHRRLGIEELRHIRQIISPVLLGAQAPTLILVASAFGLFSVETAIEISKWIILLLLFGCGFRVAQILHESRFQQIVSGLIIVAIGSLIIIIKTIFH
jgi:hemolysin III